MNLCFSMLTPGISGSRAGKMESQADSLSLVMVDNSKSDVLLGRRFISLYRQGSGLVPWLKLCKVRRFVFISVE